MIPIFDGHNDTLLRLYRGKQDGSYSFFVENDFGHLDLPRAQKGGLMGGIFAIFSPTMPGSPEQAADWGRTITEDGYRQKLNSAIDPEYARQITGEVIDTLTAMLSEAQGSVRLVCSVAEIERSAAENALALVLHFEGAEAIRADLSNLEQYYQQGLRSLGLVWSRPNLFGCGVPFAFPSSPDTGPGLTPAGKDLVRECNRLGIQVDMAHLNERGFWDVASITSAPLIVSHADVHALLPSTRNLTDAQIDAVGATGGLIGLNFEPMQIGIGGKPAEDVPLAALVHHVEYIANRVGIDHVAFGSDFDGTHMPSALGDVAGLQNLVSALRDAGFDEPSIEKVAYRNWLRVLSAAWKEPAAS